MANSSKLDNPHSKTEKLKSPSRRRVFIVGLIVAFAFFINNLTSFVANLFSLLESIGVGIPQVNQQDEHENLGEDETGRNIPSISMETMTLTTTQSQRPTSAIALTYTFTPSETPEPLTPEPISLTGVENYMIEGKVAPEYCHGYKIGVYAANTSRLDDWNLQPPDGWPTQIDGNCNWKTQTGDWQALVIFLVPTSLVLPLTSNTTNCPPRFAKEPRLDTAIHLCESK